MWYAIERFLSDPKAFVFMLIFGSITLFYLKRKDDKRREEAEAGPAPKQPTQTSASLPRPSATMPRPASRPSMPAATGDDSTSRRRSSAPGFSTRSGQIQPGFRDLRFGEAPRGEMFVYHDDGDSKLYVRSGDVLKIGEQPLTSILYSYYKNRLEAVMIDMPDSSVDRVLSSLTQEWGEPKRPNAHNQKCFWTDLLSGDDAMQAVLDKTPVTRKGSLIITSKVIKMQRERDKAK